MDLSMLLADARALHDDTVALRRFLHREPEVGLLLPRTKAAVLAALESLPVEIIEHRETSGVVAIMEGGSPGPTRLLRADMDALPMAEKTGLPFASSGESMHACGHDLHTAMLVGTARVLAARRSELAGRVVFMFQPGEEGWHGARHMLDEGLLDSAASPPDRALALHVLTQYPAHSVALRAGPLMASADQITITVTGRGGHASMPHAAADPIPAACEIVLAVETALTRQVSVFDPAVVTFGEIAAGTAHNVIPETAVLRGTMRTLSAARRAHLRQIIDRASTGVAAAHGVEATVEFEEGYPVTRNDPVVTEQVVSLAAGLTEDVVTMEHPIMGSEDWSYVLERVPGAMAFLGARPAGIDAEGAPANHSNRVVFDESVMPTGIALLAGFAFT